MAAAIWNIVKKPQRLVTRADGAALFADGTAVEESHHICYYGCRSAPMTAGVLVKRQNF